MRLSRILPLLLWGRAVSAQPATATPATAPAPASYSLTESMVPMRDGARLYTRILAPTNPAGPLPLLFVRTP